ncbi:MAG TPA: quinone-dependent dihydroorotate dehydrogenase [Verrucomicrobiae bacterium]|nr:quinone-dependent dihydroorotate dehydrogenase [Verrucomicrobiae bacterium]
MSRFYRTFIRPVLFLQESEKIHQRTLQALGWAGRRKTVLRALSSFFSPENLPVELFGLKFPNPVGLAAGMDKEALAVPAWAALGFGFSELGGVTWRAQPGNPPPRLFRARADKALINRMGFNNPGAETMAATLAQWRATSLWPHHPVGINLGKSKITPLAEAAGDYARSFRALWPLADFFVVNVSSPNTPNLRQLQEKAALDEILAALQDVNAGMATGSSNPQSPKPVLVKVAPDLSFEALDEILELAGPRKISGLVATNTTVARPGATRPDLRRIYAEAGGLSGRPLAARSTEIIRHLFRQTRGSLPLIGVGGIFNAADAWEKITAGASLVQIYTGLVYEGPGVAREIVAGLRARLAAEGMRELREAVGSRAEKTG